MKKVVSLAMAGVMAASTCIVASAETADKQLEETLAMVKSRITVAEEISEFSYNTVNGGPVTVYQFNWQTPRDTSYEERKSISVSAYSNVITHYNYYSAERTWSSEATLAKLSSDQLYSHAYSALKKLNPTVLGNIKIDRDSLRMSVYSNTATFNVYRVKNGVPVESDTGRNTLKKNTCELHSFDISWNPKA